MENLKVNKEKQYNTRIEQHTNNQDEQCENTLNIKVEIDPGIENSIFLTIYNTTLTISNPARALLNKTIICYHSEKQLFSHVKPVWFWSPLVNGSMHENCIEFPS